MQLVIDKLFLKKSEQKRSFFIIKCNNYKIENVKERTNNFNNINKRNRK